MQTITSLKAGSWGDDGLLKRGRALLPLVNIAFRASDMPELYAPILDRLQPRVVVILRELATQLKTGGPSLLNEQLLKYLVDLGGHLRFLLAE